MSKSRSNRRKSRKVEIDLTQFETVVQATEERALSKEERKVLLDAKAILERLAAPPLNNESSAAILGKESAQTDSEKPKAPPRGGRRPSATSRMPRSSRSRIRNSNPVSSANAAAGDSIR